VLTLAKTAIRTLLKKKQNTGKFILETPHTFCYTEIVRNQLSEKEGILHNTPYFDFRSVVIERLEILINILVKIVTKTL